jgi:hypothetical protein
MVGCRVEGRAFISAPLLSICLHQCFGALYWHALEYMPVSGGLARQVIQRAPGSGDRTMLYKLS